MALIEDLIAKLRGLNDSGTRQLPSGAWLIGKLPPRSDGLFADAYLHEIYRGLTEDQLKQLERLIDLKFPEPLRAFYRQANGLSLFSDSLSIRGLRTDYSRNPAVREPVSLEYGNTIERPAAPRQGYEHARKQIRFGFLAQPGAELVVYLEDETVEAVPARELGPVLCSWPGLEAMLTSEVDRMVKLYVDRRGNLDPLNPLDPPWSTE